MRITLAIPLVLAVLSQAHATTPCDQATTQAAMTQCAADGFKRADADLNVAYKQATARLQSDQAARKRLTEAQRAWITFRDADCRFVATHGGSADSMTLNLCLQDRTRSRLETLKGYLDCPEGDLACPIPPQSTKPAG